MSAAPTLSTFDPQIAGMVGFEVNLNGATTDDTVIFYESTTSGSGYAEAGFVNIRTGLDGLRICLDADGTPRYWVAKVHDSATNSYSSNSNEVSAVGSAGPPPPPPPPSAQDQLSALLGTTVNVGDLVEATPPPSVSKTVQADGSLA